MKLIALFFPAIISVCIYCKRQDVALECKLPLLIKYIVYTMVISLGSTSLVVYGFKKTPAVAELDVFEFFIKYMLIALFFSCIIPYLEEIIKKFISIRFQVECCLGKDETTQNH